MKIIAFLLTTFFAVCANAAEVVTSASANMALLDTTVATNDVTTVRYQTTVPISYSDTCWCDGAVTPDIARIMVNGEAVFEAEGEGVYDWPIVKAGTYGFSHEVNGVVTRKIVRPFAPTVEIMREGYNLCKMTASDGESAIRYTLDGGAPTLESSLYVEPFEVSPTNLTFVRACTFGEGYPQGQTTGVVFEQAGPLVCSADGITTIDTRAGKEPVPVDGSVEVAWSGLWTSDESADVVVEADGKAIVQGSGEGLESFYPPSVGSHVLTHTTYKDGQVVGEPLTATLELSPTLNRGLVLDGRAVIADGTTEIGDGAFAGQTDMTDVVIPNSVTNIAPTAFAGCVNLTNVTLHGGVSSSKRMAPELIAGSAWIEESETLDGDKVYRSNVISDGQSTVIEFDIPEGMDRLAFSWKVESEQNYDWLTWSLDGVQKDRISGSRGWATVACDLDGSPHRLEFTYSKDGSVSSSSDCGWVSVHASGKGAPTLIDLFPDSPIAVVTIGDEIAEVPEAFFANCTAMEKVVLSGAVTNIGANAFLGCENLKRVDVATLENWLKIEFANETANPLYYGAELYADGVKVQGYSRLLSPIVYENLCGATHTNPASYQEGIPVMFTPPNERTGYAFTGWTPEGIAAEMSGEQTTTAGWLANTYQIEYDANGGSGAMAATVCEYDREAALASNRFVRTGYAFMGWADSEDAVVAQYADGAVVSNLTAEAGGVVRLYAVWELMYVETPDITPADGATFETAGCTVTITCRTDGTAIYYTQDGTTPRAKPAFLYTGPFEITNTATIVAMAVKNGIQSDYAEATIIHIEPEPLTLASVLGEPKLYGISTGGDGEWMPIRDDTALVGKSSALGGVLDEDDEGTKQVSWMEAKVYGKGTLTFWWRVNCEPDPRKKFTYDYAAFEADDEDVASRDGITEEWEQVSKTFDTDGEHVIRWSYNADGYLPIYGEYEGCVWVNGVAWRGAEPPAPVVPTVEGDEGATVTGDAETGFVVKPSEENTAVEVTIPQGVDAAKVTVEVSVKVMSVKPNGAKVKIVSGGADITEFLDMPVGVVDLTQATVKEEIVKEVLDIKKGAKIELNAADPKLKTANTRVGLFYQLREGETLGGMKDGDSKVGDGQPWSPKITVKGGNSAFYSIGVGKGE